VRKTLERRALKYGNSMNKKYALPESGKKVRELRSTNYGGR